MTGPVRIVVRAAESAWRWWSEPVESTDNSSGWRPVTPASGPGPRARSPGGIELERKPRDLFWARQFVGNLLIRVLTTPIGLAAGLIVAAGRWRRETTSGRPGSATVDDKRDSEA